MNVKYLEKFPRGAWWTEEFGGKSLWRRIRGKVSGVVGKRRKEMGWAGKKKEGLKETTESNLSTDDLEQPREFDSVIM